MPAQAGIQYAAASRLKPWRLWNTGSPSSRVTTAEDRSTAWNV